MRVLQYTLFNQGFKIALLHLPAQVRIYPVSLKVRKGPAVVVQPAVHHLNAVHKPLGSSAEIRLPVLEFVIIDCGQKRLLLKALVHDSLQGLSDDRFKFLLPFHGGSLCHHSKERLLYAILIHAEHILAYSAVDQRLLDGRAGHGTEGKVQDLPRPVLLLAKILSQRKAP